MPKVPMLRQLWSFYRASAPCRSRPDPARTVPASPGRPGDHCRPPPRQATEQGARPVSIHSGRSCEGSGREQRRRWWRCPGIVEHGRDRLDGFALDVAAHVADGDVTRGASGDCFTFQAFFSVINRERPVRYYPDRGRLGSPVIGERGRENVLRLGDVGERGCHDPM